MLDKTSEASERKHVKGTPCKVTHKLNRPEFTGDSNQPPIAGNPAGTVLLVADDARS